MYAICTICKENKEHSSNGHGGWQTICKDCTRKRWEDGVTKKRAKLKDMQRNNPLAWDRLVLSTLYANASNRAKKLGVVFSITRDDIPLEHVCPVMQCSMALHAGKQEDNSYSLDRIDSARGYEPGNVRVISFRANFLKNEITLEQAKRLVQYMEGKL